MLVLLDRHAFLWFVLGDTKLSATARSSIEDTSNEAALSLASVWEMTIKHGYGKLPLDRPLREFIEHETGANSIDLWPVTQEHIYRLLELSTEHRDPFDRILAAQCLVEDCALISTDRTFDLFGVQRIWD